MGYLFAALALGALAYDLWRGPLQDEDFASTSTAEHWREVDANSLVGFGAYIEQKVSPDLWFDWLLPALGWPAWALAGILASLFFLIGGRGKRRSQSGLVFPRKRR
ncbi:MAG: hypothetical protein AAFN79_10655 [Pseudomonadota bacterium]